jgi:LysM repeat protein
MRRLIIALFVCLIPLNSAYADTTPYVVQKGDNLYRLALRFQVSVSTIKNANGLTSDLIYIGQQLIIPSPNATVIPPTPAATANPTSTSYNVQAGDTLYKISRRYNVEVNALRTANNLLSDTIYIGQTLLLPTSTNQTTQAILIRNISGGNQALPLDCEARSAVDWARYFGTDIDELEFFKRLPTSDDPDIGFVGDVNGLWGQTPPNAYGVHAEPIAALLRQYNINAIAKRNMNLDDLRRELNANRPVIVWIVGHVTNGKGFNYTAKSGRTTLVAPYEHTAIVIGYNATTFTFLDNAQIYSRPIATFQSSWSALGNMAVTLR